MTEQKVDQTVSQTNEQVKGLLSQFGRSFQEKLFQAVLTDRSYAEQMLEVMNCEYFDLKYLQFLAERYFAYAKRYKVFPTLQLLIGIVKDELKTGNDTLLRDQVVEYLQRMKTNPDPGDLPYVKERSLDWFRRQSLKEALEKAVDLVATEKYESIVDVIKNAVAVGTTPSHGHDFMNDMDARFVKISRDCVPTGFEQLDAKDVFNGGAGAGELCIVQAATSVGKSHFLVAIGAAAMKAGKNVVHYTLELSETNVGIRYDSHFCDIPSNEVVDRKDEIIEKYKEMNLGKLIIKSYPANTATIFTLRSHIEKLSLKGFRPDLIIVDYADIMRSSRQYDSLRHELKLIYEELRSYADEIKIPIWSASQTNRESSQSDVVGLESMSESYGKAFTADVIVSLSRKIAEKASGWGRLYIAKNRNGIDGIVFPIKIDTAKSQFFITGDRVLPDEAKRENESDTKRALRQKLRELEKDNGLNLTKVPKAIDIGE